MNEDGRFIVVGRSPGAGKASEWIGYDRVTAAARPGVKPARPDSRTHSHDGKSSIETNQGFEPGTKRWGPGIVWRDAASRSVRRRFTIPDFHPFHLSFSADDQSIRAVLANVDPVLPSGRTWKIVTWNLATGAMVERPITANIEHMVAFTPDGRLGANLDRARRGVQIWDLDTGQPKGRLIPVDKGVLFGIMMLHLSPIQLAPDRRTLVVPAPAGRTEFWDMPEARLIRSGRDHPGGMSVGSLKFSPDGRTLASSGHSFDRRPSPWYRTLIDRFISRLNRPTSELAVIDLASGQVFARAAGSAHGWFSPDGRTIVTRESNGTFAVRAIPPHQ